MTSKFPGSTVRIGGTGSGDNREIPIEEGGDYAKTGRYVSLVLEPGKSMLQRMRTDVSVQLDQGEGL